MPAGRWRMAKPVPKALAKHGITRVVSNLQPDQEVVLPPGLITTLFGEELLERLRPAPTPQKKQRRVLCPPSTDCL